MVTASARAARRTFPFLLITLAGCIPFRGQQANHVLVIGFGVVSVNRTQAVATVSRVNSLGLMVTDQPGPKFSVGYTASTVVSVNPDTNILIEASQVPFGTLKVSR